MADREEGGIVSCTQELAITNAVASLIGAGNPTELLEGSLILELEAKRSVNSLSGDSRMSIQIALAETLPDHAHALACMGECKI